MLLRIYDIILTEGASETLMRVALSLMRRNSDRIIACTELEGTFLSLSLQFGIRQHFFVVGFVSGFVAAGD